MPPVLVLCPSHLGAPPRQGKGGELVGSGQCGAGAPWRSAFSTSCLRPDQVVGWRERVGDGDSGRGGIWAELCPQTSGSMAVLGSLSLDTHSLWWTEGSRAGRRIGNRGRGEEAQPSQHSRPDTAPLLGTGLGPPHLGGPPHDGTRAERACHLPLEMRTDWVVSQAETLCAGPVTSESGRWQGRPGGHDPKKSGNRTGGRRL